MEKGSEPYLAFEWQGQIYYWRALPFGLSSAPEAFEYVMQQGLRKLLRGPCKIPQLGFLDDTGAVIHDQQSSHLQMPDIVTQARGGSYGRRGWMNAHNQHRARLSF